mmetsp:Transcript_16197/g.37244  ORF Transcript_16197/g.37244 Transcript_16197/m.37244 type:complete len:215 (+) Transcript_16197:429-1073(+)
MLKLLGGYVPSGIMVKLLEYCLQCLQVLLLELQLLADDVLPVRIVGCKRTLDENACNNVDHSEDRKCDVDNPRKAKLRRELPQALVIHTPIIATRHRLVQRHDGPVQCAKVLQQLLIGLIQELVHGVKLCNGPISEVDAEDEENQTQHQEDPHKRNHRVEDGRYHHPQLTEESHHSNDAHHPNDAHDTKNAEDGYVRHSFSQCHCFQHDFHPAQ